jgi:signal transduction histidine kinase
VSSAGSLIFTSASRLIFRRSGIGRLADDRRLAEVYLRVVHLRLSRLRPFPLEPVKVDWALAVLLTVGAQLAIWLGSDAAHHRLGAALVAPAITAPIAVRRRFPALVGTAVPLVAAVDHDLWDPQFVGYPVATICALYALTAWTPPRRFALGFALVVAVYLAFSVGGPFPNNGVTFAVVTAVVMLLVRRVLGDRERRARVAERERDVAAREAVVEERARIARELHDAIAHNVSMMVVQAGAERRVLDGSGGSTREVLETIERIGRGALTEMRRLVGMLRSDTGDELAPQPGLSELPTLVTQVREAGLPVELRVEGEPRELPVGIELSAYRIVQEALTNALKHAGEAHASVQVRYGAESLELEIVDDGPGGQAPVVSGGHGLAGMRERVALYGGRLDAGRRPSGGFAVRVLLPIR